MSRRRHAERGQVIPMWIGAILTTFGLMFFGLNYANTIRWQIRAQNAADAAAQGVLAIQTQRWNIMLQTLYASNVEEYRMRHILDGILLAVNDSGGCTINLNYLRVNYEVFDQGTCSESYVTLNAAFQKSAQRYTADVELLNDISYTATNANWASDARQMLLHMQSTSRCNNDRVTQAVYASDPAGGDCAFRYTIPADGIAYETGLQAVEMDAYSNLVPGLGRTATYSAAQNNGPDSENPALFAPAKVDVVTCALVPPLIAGFGPFHAKSYYVIGRAAAQATQVEQDWFEPGALADPTLSTPGNRVVFQPHEIWNSVGPNPAPSANPWYDVDFGGNVATATSYENHPYFSEPFYNNEMSARLGWWNAIPTQTFATKVSTALDCP